MKQNTIKKVDSKEELEKTEQLVKAEFAELS